MSGQCPTRHHAVAFDRDSPGFGGRVQSMLRACAEGRPGEARQLAETLGKEEVEAMVALGDQVELLLDVPPELVAALLGALVDARRRGPGRPGARISACMAKPQTCIANASTR